MHAGWLPSTVEPKSHLGAFRIVAKHRVNPGYLNGLLSGHPFASLHCFSVVVVVAVAAVVGHAHVNAPSGHAQKAGGAAVVALTVGAVVVAAVVV